MKCIRLGIQAVFVMCLSNTWLWGGRSSGQHDALYSRLIPFCCQRNSTCGVMWLPSWNQEGDSNLWRLL